MISPRLLKLVRFLLAVGLLLACQPALADKRVALVIGNAAYRNVAPLPNPANDAAVIATTLRDAGFDVVDSRRDLSSIEMRRALREFADHARDADIAVVYYAGHGIEVNGNNFLIPVDARLERDTDAYDEAISLDRILLAIEPAKQLRLVILDACRDNPFAKTMKRTAASRSIGRGLAEIDPSSPNTLIAYSAKAGSTALDGDSKNSPFTLALAKHLTTPGLDVRRALGFVRDDVLKSTRNQQEPFVYGSLGGDDLPLVPAKAAPAPVPALNSQADIRRDYELALQIGNKEAFNAFLAQHPDGFYASLAKLQLNKLDAEERRVAATEKAERAEQERARLAAEGGQTSQQAKLDADAKAAEQARISAEQAKQVAQEQAAEAERRRAEAEATEAAGGNKVADANAPARNAVASAAGPQPAAENKAQPNVASLTAALPPGQLITSVQNELRRVGCLTAAADGEWNAASQRSMTQFNRYAGTKLDVKLASLDALDAIKQRPSRVCPLVCEHGFRADGERCSRIACAEGSFLNEDNECEKRRTRTVARRDDAERPNRPLRERTKPAVAPRPQAAGQIVCDYSGCRPVRRGCHLEFRDPGNGGPREGAGNVQICN